MRLWTLHPRYLDAQGLVAAWREALLAQKVLRGETRGYRHHPQLIRFREQEDSLSAVALFLTSLADEAERRGYRFDRGKMGDCRTQVKISETRGQLLYEWGHLLDKLQVRSPQWYTRYRDVEIPDAHPLFHIIPGNIREWERRDS